VDHQAALTTIMGQLKRIARDWPVVFPMHPRTRKMCGQFGIALDDNPGLRILEPIGYHDSLCFTESARFILTDSGGLQEESTYFKTPCLTLRPNTERPITITHGSNKLTRLDCLSSDIDGVLNCHKRNGHVPPLWDGRAAERIVDCLIAAS
jgi:UDP-N-acetylglucosamine 2-epimerase (non-hydrolysing)